MAWNENDYRWPDIWVWDICPLKQTYKSTCRYTLLEIWQPGMSTIRMMKWGFVQLFQHLDKPQAYWSFIPFLELHVANLWLSDIHSSGGSVDTPCQSMSLSHPLIDLNFNATFSLQAGFFSFLFLSRMKMTILWHLLQSGICADLWPADPLKG